MSEPAATIPEAFSALLRQIQNKDRLQIQGVIQNARPFWAACLAFFSGRPVLWILPEEAQAEAAAAAAKTFLGGPARSPSDPFADAVIHFPLHQPLPYDNLSPDRFAVAERLALLFRLSQGSAPPLMVSSVQALMRLGISHQAVDQASQLVLKGQELDRRELSKQLVRIGYLHVPLVEDPGTFSIRGSILDIFSPQLPNPVRIELLGDEVESIRAFDPNSQRTISHLDSAYLGPVREIFIDAESQERALSQIEQVGSALDLPSYQQIQIKRMVRSGVWFFGIEALLPAYCSELESLFEHLPAQTVILFEDPGSCLQTIHETVDRAQSAYQEAVSANNLVFSPQTMLLSAAMFQNKLRSYPQIALGLSDQPGPTVDFRFEEIPPIHELIQKTPPGEDALAPLIQTLASFRRQKFKIFIATTLPNKSREIFQLLRHRGIPTRLEEEPFDLRWLEQETPSVPVRIVSGDLPAGFASPDGSIAFLSESDIFGQMPRRERPSSGKRKLPVIKPRDFVVHVDFGIGQFDGLTKLAVGGAEGDYLLLLYRGGDRLYLPVTRMNLIERYCGPEGKSPPLSKLGTDLWEKTKQRVQLDLLQIADGLVRLEAERRVRPGQATRPPGEEYKLLQAAFPFEETEDQKMAIHKVIEDLVESKAMDRLVCGDVGFGKTEVAIRAAYIKALSGQQTAVMVPTTILALQHLSTFRARLSDRAVRVEMLSRLVKPSEQKSILADLAEGKVDVLIGTHRLLKPDVKFRSLGLTVIDEEHRFGVKHKEKLKQLRKDVDVLTMTATPIPRTLQLSLTGLRDISVISTPPPGRRSIRTLVTRFSKRIISEAIRRELQRGGQVFFLHNWTSSLPAMQRFIQRLVPEARTAIAHGKMPEGKLESVMTDFIKRNIDVLICTSIIESGLDIPSANTILINRADHFGVSQLHQIRGRVGRAADRAYAYFLIPGISSITADARRRLEVLSEHSELGSGYQIATQDLELRGAGNLLGEAQAGHIAAVGFDLYSRLLERAVMEVRGQVSTGRIEPEIKLPVAGFLPEDYVPELEQRLDLYSRLSHAESEEAIFGIEKEIADRFGAEPEEVINLCELMALKSRLRTLKILSLEFKGNRLEFKIEKNSPVNSERIVSLVQNTPLRFSISPDGVLLVSLDPEEKSTILQTTNSLLAFLTER